MSGPAPWTRWGFATGAASVVLLPAWDAVNQLPALERHWTQPAWLLGGTAVLAVALRWAVIRRHGPAQVARWLIIVAIALLAFDAASYLYAHLKVQIELAAGAHYVRWRSAAIGAAVTFLSAIVIAIWRYGWRASLGSACNALAMLAALPIVAMATFALNVPTRLHEITRSERERPITVVLIFDELDASELAEARDELPHFRALSRTALAATSMFPPANYTTESLPAMLTGEDYAYVKYTLNEIYVQPVGQSEWSRVSERRSLISDAVTQGKRVDVVGWHLPYCRVFVTVQSCWDDASFRVPGQHISLVEWLRAHNQLLRIIDQHRLDRLRSDIRSYSRLFFGLPENFRLRHIGEILDKQAKSLLSVLDAERSDLVFAHLACPHPPSVQAANVDDLDMFAAYRGNLRVCDELLGEVLRRLARQTRSRGTALIVTSDHWFRGLDWLAAGRPEVIPTRRRPVPFLVWLNGADGHAQSTAAVSSSRVLPSVVHSLLSGKQDYPSIRDLIDKQGDGVTRLRIF